jgi:hypothetical protein
MSNAYEEKQERKKEALQRRADSLRAKADELHSAGRKALEAIPFGQPILVGHHSERSDRAYRGRAVGKIDRSIELGVKANDLERKAESVGTGGISSDDPDAIEKLEKKLLQAEEAHAFMLECNKDARRCGNVVPYLHWQISNSRGRITAIKNRIQGLEHIASQPTGAPLSGNGWRVAEDADDNRIILTLDARPDDSLKKLLRSYAFLWSPSREAWVRKITPNARLAVKQLTPQLPTI